MCLKDIFKKLKRAVYIFVTLVPFNIVCYEISKVQMDLVPQCQQFFGFKVTSSVNS